MEDAQFYKEIKEIFASYLIAQSGELIVRVRDKAKNKILSEQDMNYNKVMFDSNLVMYKKDKDGNYSKVENPNFEVVVMQKNS